MAKKRNRRTRKKYKKRGGASDAEMKECNTRLKEQGIGMVKRRNMCIEMMERLVRKQNRNQFQHNQNNLHNPFLVK